MPAGATLVAITQFEYGRSLSAPRTVILKRSHDNTLCTKWLFILYLDTSQLKVGQFTHSILWACKLKLLTNDIAYIMQFLEPFCICVLSLLLLLLLCRFLFQLLFYPVSHSLLFYHIVTNECLSINCCITLIHVLLYFSFWQLTVELRVAQPMARLVTLVEQHMDRQPPTVVIQVTTSWEAVLALVNPLEDGLGVHLTVKVCLSIYSHVWEYLCPKH